MFVEIAPGKDGVGSSCSTSAIVSNARGASGDVEANVR